MTGDRQAEKRPAAPYRVADDPAVQAAVAELVAAAPPLSAWQRAQLRLLLPSRALTSAAPPTARRAA